MITVALVNSKPGTGKTSGAVWLSHAYLEMGFKVLLVDADPSASALEWSDLSGGFPFRLIGLPTKDLWRRLPDIARPGEVVIIDAPQTEDHAAIASSAMRAASEVVIPCAPTPIEVSRTSPMLARLADVNVVRDQAARSAVLLNRTVANARSTDDARDALSGVGFDVLAATVPRLELFAQSFGNPVNASGTVWTVIAAELLNRGGITP